MKPRMSASPKPAATVVMSVTPCIMCAGLLDGARWLDQGRRVFAVQAGTQQARPLPSRADRRHRPTVEAKVVAVVAVEAGAVEVGASTRRRPHHPRALRRRPAALRTA